MHLKKSSFDATWNKRDSPCKINRTKNTLRRSVRPTSDYQNDHIIAHVKSGSHRFAFALCPPMSTHQLNGNVLNAVLHSTVFLFFQHNLQTHCAVVDAIGGNARNHHSLMMLIMTLVLLLVLMRAFYVCLIARCGICFAGACLSMSGAKC